MDDVWKHPHACGEDPSPYVTYSAPAETPPRMWGRLTKIHTYNRMRRNTPTQVGKTSRGFSVTEHKGKHPHACGEDFARCCCLWCIWETPPRMWGRLELVDPLGLGIGNTPTHVGKTWWIITPKQLYKKYPHACGEDCNLKSLRYWPIETPPRMWGRRQNGCN